MCGMMLQAIDFYVCVLNLMSNLRDKFLFSILYVRCAVWDRAISLPVFLYLDSVKVGINFRLSFAIWHTESE